jgi:hypothetical protein
MGVDDLRNMFVLEHNEAIKGETSFGTEFYKEKYVEWLEHLAIRVMNEDSGAIDGYTLVNGSV